MKAIVVSLFFMLILFSGCASKQHLVFFTNTTIGVEISSSPETASPGNFIVGYKRQEGVIDPLIPNYSHIKNSNNITKPKDPKELNKYLLGAMIEKESNNGFIVQTREGTFYPNDKEHTKAHSVFAKINFGSNVGESGVSVNQWFSSGYAAELLASNMEIDDLKNEKINFQNLVYSDIVLLYGIFKTLKNTKDKDNIQRNLDELYLDEYIQDLFIITKVNKKFEILSYDEETKDFDNLIKLVKKLDDSISYSNEIILSEEFKNYEQNDRKKVLQILKEQPLLKEKIERNIIDNKIVKDYLIYTYKSL